MYLHSQRSFVDFAFHERLSGYVSFSSHSDRKIEKLRRWAQLFKVNSRSEYLRLPGCQDWLQEKNIRGSSGEVVRGNQHRRVGEQNLIFGITKIIIVVISVFIIVVNSGLVRKPHLLHHQHHCRYHCQYRTRSSSRNSVRGNQSLIFSSHPVPLFAQKPIKL